MHTITIDDKSLSVSSMLRVLKKKDPDGTHIGTVRIEEFLDYVSAHSDIDIAFIDVEMKTDGITLTKMSNSHKATQKLQAEPNSMINAIYQ